MKTIEMAIVHGALSIPLIVYAPLFNPAPDNNALFAPQKSQVLSTTFLPYVAGLFFGKRRSSHTSSLNRMNRRSYGSSDLRPADWRPEASRFCAMIHTTCLQWGVYDEN